jgi:hypothetical protein
MPPVYLRANTSTARADVLVDGARDTSSDDGYVPLRAEMKGIRSGEDGTAAGADDMDWHGSFW